VAFATGVYLVMSHLMMYDALVVSDPGWNLAAKEMSRLSMHLTGKAADGYQAGRAAKARNDPQTTQVAPEKCCNGDLIVAFEVAADTRSHDMASRYEHAGQRERRSSRHMIAEVVADSVAAGTHIDAAAAEGYSAAVAIQIETAEASVCRKAAAAKRKSHSSGCLENMHMDRPWVRLSLEQELLGRRTDCTGPDMGPGSRWHSSEDCTAVSDLVVIEATEHSAGGCTSGAAGIGQHTTPRTKSLAVKQDCCSSILLATVALDRQRAAGYMYAVQGIVAAAAVEAAAAAAADLRILHFALAGIGCIDRGNDWTRAVGIGRPGSKTLCRGSGCGQATPSRGALRELVDAPKGSIASRLDVDSVGDPHGEADVYLRPRIGCGVSHSMNSILCPRASRVVVVGSSRCG
jgi:hypothetical protein